MRTAANRLVTLSLLIATPQLARAAAPEGAAYHIVLSGSAVSAGEQVEMKLVPPVPPGIRVSWPVAIIYSAISASSAAAAPDGPARLPVRVPGAWSRRWPGRRETVVSRCTWPSHCYGLGMHRAPSDPAPHS